MRERGPEEQARAWAEASAHRDVAPERAREWDEDLRRIGVDPDRIRETSDWLRNEAERRAEGLDKAAQLHDDMDANLIIAGDRESDRAHATHQPGQDGRDAGADQAEHHAAATTDYADAHQQAAEAHEDRTRAAVQREQGDSAAAGVTDQWVNGAPPAQLAGKAHPTGRASDTRTQKLQTRRASTPTRTATHTKTAASAADRIRPWDCGSNKLVFPA